MVNWRSYTPKVFFKLFDSQIQPILTYGAEIWGLVELDNQEVIERIHLFTPPRNRGGVIFSLQCVCVSVCVCVCVCVRPDILVNKIPAERMHRFGRGIR